MDSLCSGVSHKVNKELKKAQLDLFHHAEIHPNHKQMLEGCVSIEMRHCCHATMLARVIKYYFCP